MEVENDSGVGNRVFFDKENVFLIEVNRNIVIVLVIEDLYFLNFFVRLYEDLGICVRFWE